jgi:SAM-dependent methyltransferase
LQEPPEETVTLDSLRETARRAYGADAAGYAKGRPDYPEEVYRVLIDRCGLRDGAVVLEIGPGTGLVTQRLVAHGASVLAVEPDPAMAEFLALATSGSDVDVVVATFEQAIVPDNHFDLIVAATSFHWVDQIIGVPKLGRAVRPGGWVALWWTIFDDPDREDPFRQATRQLLGGGDPDGQRHRASFQLDTVHRCRELQTLGGFHEVSSQLFYWTARFDAARLRAFYGSLIEVHRRTASEQRSLLDAIEVIARDDFDGDVTRPFVTVLYTGKRPGDRVE